MATPVEEISGIGPHTANVLQEHGFKTIKSILKGGKTKLMEVPGFGSIRAQAILDAARALMDEPEKPKKKKDKKKSGKSKKTKDTSKTKKSNKESKAKGSDKSKKSKDKKSKNKQAKSKK